MPKALDVLKAHISYPYLFSKERRGERGEFIHVSNSELRRWFENGAVYMDGVRVNWDTDVSIFSDIVLFPKGHQVSLGPVHIYMYSLADTPFAPWYLKTANERLKV